jgi:hypothetical protein
MYDSPSDHGTAEYIELYNRGTDTINLTGVANQRRGPLRFPR